MNHRRKLKKIILITYPLCHSERPLGAKNLGFTYKIPVLGEILRRSAPQNDNAARVLGDHNSI